MESAADFSGIRRLADKLPEHAARLGAVLTLTGNELADEVEPEAMAAGIELANHYAGEALRLHMAGGTDSKLLEAEKLRQWCLRQHGGVVAFRDICRRGQNSIRDAATARPLVQILVDHRWLVPIEGGAGRREAHSGGLSGGSGVNELSFAKFDPRAALEEIRWARGRMPQLSQPRRRPVASPTFGFPEPQQQVSGAVATVATVAGSRPQNSRRAPGQGWTPVDWRRYYNERAAAAMINGQQPEAQARAIAYECCIVMWLTLNPAASDPSRCCYCGESGHREILMPFGSASSAWLHHRCWRPWHDAKRQQAVGTLAESGIRG